MVQQCKIKFLFNKFRMDAIEERAWNFEVKEWSFKSLLPGSRTVIKSVDLFEPQFPYL